MKSTVRIILWIAVAGLGLVALFMMLGSLDTSGTDAAGRGLSRAFGFLLALNAAAAALALLFVRRWRGWLIIAAVIVGLPFALVTVLAVASRINDARYEQERANRHTGRSDFARQPALRAVAEAIAKNDENGIRAAAKDVPNLQAPGLDGKTLLYFAVDESLERPELVKAVSTLLSLGADPNYTSEHAESFALAHAAKGAVLLLRTMLDAGGNPNALDERGQPMIFGNWQMTYFEADRTARFGLLLGRGADINSTLPEKAPGFGGYTLAMYRASMGRGDGAGYADALDLLQRGADPSRAARDGATLMTILTEHGKWFSEQGETPPAPYQALCDWLKAHGVER